MGPPPASISVVDASEGLHDGVLSLRAGRELAMVAICHEEEDSEGDRYQTSDGQQFPTADIGARLSYFLFHTVYLLCSFLSFGGKN